MASISQTRKQQPSLTSEQRIRRSLFFSSLPANTLEMLDYWYDQKFDHGAPTTQLMARVKDEADRIVLGVVAMLDLDPNLLRAQMTPEEWQFVDACHCYLRQSHN